MNNPNYTVGTGIEELYAARRPSFTDNTVPVEVYQVLRALPGSISVTNNGARPANPLFSINRKFSSSRRAAKNIWRGGLSTCLFKVRARFWIASRFLPAVCGFAPPSPKFNDMTIESTSNFIIKGGKRENRSTLRGLLSSVEKVRGNPATSILEGVFDNTPDLRCNANEGCEK